MSAAVFEPVRVLVENRFKNGWSTRTAVKWPNVVFAQPANTAWVALSIRWGESNQASIGPATRRLERHQGVVVIQVFVPKNSGEKALAEHLDFAGSLFRMETELDSTNGVEISYQTPYRTYRGEEKELRQENLIVPFTVDALF